MASYLPGHHFPSGRHHVLYQATDAEGNKAKCGFTVTVQKGGDAVPGHSWSHTSASGHSNTTPRPAWFSPRTPPSSSSSNTVVDGGYFTQRHHHRYNVPEKCYRAPPVRDFWISSAQLIGSQ